MPNALSIAAGVGLHLTYWLSQLEEKKATARKGLTTASIRKMIARLQEELAEYEAAGELPPAAAEQRPEPNDGGVEREA